MVTMPNLATIVPMIAMYAKEIVFGYTFLLGVLIYSIIQNPFATTYWAAKRNTRPLVLVINKAHQGFIKNPEVKDGHVVFHQGNAQVRVPIDATAKITLPGNVSLFVIYDQFGMSIKPENAIACQTWKENKERPPENEQGETPEDVEIKIEPTVVKYADVMEYEEYNNNPVIRENLISREVNEQLRADRNWLNPQMFVVLGLGVMLLVGLWMLVSNDGKTAFESGRATGYSQGLTTGKQSCWEEVATGGYAKAAKVQRKPTATLTPESTDVGKNA